MSGEKRRLWLFSIAVSLLLHLPIFLLLTSRILEKPSDEPKLALRAVRAAARADEPRRPEAAKERKQRPKQSAAAERPQPQKPKTNPDREAKLPTAPKKNQAPEQAAPEQISPGQNNANPNEAAAMASAPGIAGRAATVPDDVSAEPINVYALQITKKVVPDYSAFSRKRREEGAVKIILTIKNGAVSNAEIIDSSGYERLDNSALRAARQWRFSMDEEIRAVVTFNFSLTD